MPDDDATTITLTAIESPNLDTTCYRGSARLADLARISQADIFDQDANPNGLQRDLNRRHALEAYDYAARPTDTKYPRAFPEVILNVRDTEAMKLTHTEVEGYPVRDLTFNLEAIDKRTQSRGQNRVAVSRVDGNHRLWFGAGDGKDRPALDVMVPFQIHVGLKREQETALFRDVNAEQKGLNSSHLAYLHVRADPRHGPELDFARSLASDAASPWNGLVYFGGSKAGARQQGVKRPVAFKTLADAVRRTLRRSDTLASMASTDAQYAMIRTYWQAVAQVWPEGFESYEDHMLLKNVGVMTLAQLGGTVIERALAAGPVDVSDLAEQLLPAREAIDWSKATPAQDGGVVGLSGNQAINLIVPKLTQSLGRPAGVPAGVA